MKFSPDKMCSFSNAHLCKNDRENKKQNFYWNQGAKVLRSCLVNVRAETGEIRPTINFPRPKYTIENLTQSVTCNNRPPYTIYAWIAANAFHLQSETKTGKYISTVSFNFYHNHF